MARHRFLYFAALWFIFTMPFIHAETGNQAKIGNSDKDRKYYDSTELAIPPSPPESVEKLAQLIKSLQAKDALLGQRDEEIMIETANRPAFHKKFAELKDLQQKFDEHNKAVEDQHIECQGLLKAGGNGTSMYTQCYHKYVFLQNGKKRLESKKTAKLKEIFSENYDEWKDLQGRKKVLGLLIQTFQESQKYMSSLNCHHYLDPRAQKQCFDCFWDKAQCPESLPSPNFKRRIDYILKNQDKIIAEDLAYEDLP